MQYRNWLSIFALMMLIILISACGRAPEPTSEPTAEPTRTELPAPTAANTPTIPATAAPQPTEPPVDPGSGGNAYPVPQIEYVPYDPYPDPIEGEEIEWAQVEALLQNENISQVFQQYTLQVVITLDDGGIILVVEPGKDEIFKLLDACGERCNNIRRLSEF